MRWLRYVHPSHIVIFVLGMYFLPPSGKPKSIEAWICLVGLISEAPSGKNPEIKIPGFLLFPVQHFDDVVAELGMQRAGWLQFRAGETTLSKAGTIWPGGTHPDRRRVCLTDKWSVSLPACRNRRRFELLEQIERQFLFFYRICSAARFSHDCALSELG